MRPKDEVATKLVFYFQIVHQFIIST